MNEITEPQHFALFLVVVIIITSYFLMKASFYVIYISGQIFAAIFFTGLAKLLAPKTLEEIDLDIHLGHNDLELKKGRTTCRFCGRYCGQCSNARQLDLTAEEYRERFMK